MKILILIILSIISAILYRIGGASKQDREKEFPWLPFKPWKSRDVWSNAVTLLGALAVGVTGPWWAWLLAFGLSWASLSTYWDELFGYDNHYAHGFMIGLSMLPLAFFSSPVALGLRAIILAILMGVYSQIEGNATREELGRGFVMPLTFAILLI